MLARPMDLMIWRATTDNDGYDKEPWINEHFHKVYFKAKNVEMTCDSKQCKIKVQGVLGANSRLPVFTVDVIYTINSNDVNVEIHAVKGEVKFMHRSSSEETTLDLNMKQELDEVPRFAMRIPLKSDFEQIEYFGKGPRECYVDYQEHAKMGYWKNTVSAEYEPYIRPQECGNHVNVKYLTVSGQDKVVFKSEKPFEFSALHYTMEDLDKANHTYELRGSDSTEVLLCYKNRGIGSNSCGPKLQDKYKIKDKVIDFDFTLQL